MTQIIRPAAALFARLRPVYDDSRELSHTAATHVTKNHFLEGMRDVTTVMVHETDGSVARSRMAAWTSDYRNANGSGGGPQLAIWPDGSVVSLVELPYITTHGNFQNHRCIGIESGHANDGRFGDVEAAPNLTAGGTPRNGWVELSPNSEDVTGSTSVKFYRLAATKPATGFDTEIIVAPWATTNYTTPAREAPGPNQGGMYNTLIRKSGAAAVPPVPSLMVFPEAQYRSWALLARYLAEAFLVPRNFPVLPHARSDHMTADSFRAIVAADQNYSAILGGLGGMYHGVRLSFVDGDFTDPTQTTSLRTHFGRKGVAKTDTTAAIPAVAPEMDQGTIAGLTYVNSALNLAWLRLFDFYRGFHGHGFSGNSVAGQDDHDCPGPMFDWHRFAREVWDWWWYPFDFDATHATTAPPNAPPRPYRRAAGTTPLVEYYYYETAAPYTARVTDGIHGPRSSPATYRLEQNAAVYSLANGELVAARFPNTPDGRISMGWALVRHEVFHQLDPRIAPRPAGAPDAANGGAPDAGRLDYNSDPSIVYSLHMHLGRPAGLDFANVADANPDWLNRVLIRKKECELALPSGASGALAAALSTTPATIPEAAFTTPPGVHRPTPIEGWRLDLDRYGTFLTQLAAGNIAYAPTPINGVDTLFGPTPMRVILGDFMGVAGVINVAGGTTTYGTRIEVFSKTLIDHAWTSVLDQNDWNVASTVTRPALQYQSEWARFPDAAESARLTALGVDPSLVTWWPAVVQTMAWDARLPQDARLWMSGLAFHYDPITFMQWINGVTWASEWPKYRIAGAIQQPRSRRV